MPSRRSQNQDTQLHLSMTSVYSVIQECAACSSVAEQDVQDADGYAIQLSEPVGAMIHKTNMTRSSLKIWLSFNHRIMACP